MKEISKYFGVVTWYRIERLKRLVWCYNNYFYPYVSTPTMPFMLFLLAEYYGKVKKNCPPEIWLPEIRTE